MRIRLQRLRLGSRISSAESNNVLSTTNLPSTSRGSTSASMANSASNSPQNNPMTSKAPNSTRMRDTIIPQPPDHLQTDNSAPLPVYFSRFLQNELFLRKGGKCEKTNLGVPITVSHILYSLPVLTSYC